MIASDWLKTLPVLKMLPGFMWYFITWYWLILPQFMFAMFAGFWVKHNILTRPGEHVPEAENKNKNKKD